MKCENCENMATALDSVMKERTSLQAEVKQLRMMVVEQQCIICGKTFLMERSNQYRRVTCSPDCFSEHMSRIKREGAEK